MTGRINLTPEAERQLNEIDDWIAKNATAEIARRFISAILEHIEGILVFPLAGRPRDDVRPGRGQRPRRFPRRPELGGRAQRGPGPYRGLTRWPRAWQKRGRRVVRSRRRPTPTVTFAQVSRTMSSLTTNT